MLSLKIALFDEEYGTIFTQDVVPYYSLICYHILLQFGTIFFIKRLVFNVNFALLLFQYHPFSISKRLQSNLKGLSL